MALIRSISALVLDAIAKDNPDLPIKPTLDNCTPYAFATNEARRSQCLVKGRFGSGLRGKTRVWFHKLDVDVLTKLIDRSVPKVAGTTTLAYLPAINRMYGFDLKPSEIVDYPVINNGKTVRLTVQPENIVFCGTVDLTIRESYPTLVDLITVKDIEPAFNPLGFGETIPAVVLTYAHDYSAVGGLLAPLTVGVLDTATSTALATGLKTVDTVPWGLVPDTLYSLADAEVLYNGPSANVPEAWRPYTSTRYDYVLLIQPVNSVGLSDFPLIINYNVYSELRS
jgi:hypothetical protein